MQPLHIAYEYIEFNKKLDVLLCQTINIDLYDVKLKLRLDLGQDSGEEQLLTLMRKKDGVKNDLNTEEEVSSHLT